MLKAGEDEKVKTDVQTPPDTKKPPKITAPPDEPNKDVKGKEPLAKEKKEPKTKKASEGKMSLEVEVELLRQAIHLVASYNPIAMASLKASFPQLFK